MNKLAELWSDIVQCWSDSSMQYLTGALKTIELAVIATIIGCLIGLVCGIIQTIPCGKKDNIVKRVILGIVKAIVRIYVEVFRGTPMIIQAIFIFYALPYFSNGAINLEPTFAAYLVVSINTGAYMAETVRGGIMSIDVGQTEGAMSIGMNHFKTMLYVILPQHHPADRQQPHNQHQGYFRHVRYRLRRALRGSQGYRRRKVCLLPVGSYNADYLPDNDGHLLAYPQTVGEEA